MHARLDSRSLLLLHALYSYAVPWNAIKEDQCDSQIFAVFGTKGLFLAFTHIALVLVGDSEACHEYPKLSGQVKISALLVPCAHC